MKFVCHCIVGYETDDPEKAFVRHEGKCPYCQSNLKIEKDLTDYPNTRESPVDVFQTKCQSCGYRERRNFWKEELLKIGDAPRRFCSRCKKDTTLLLIGA